MGGLCAKGLELESGVKSVAEGCGKSEDERNVEVSV